MFNMFLLLNFSRPTLNHPMRGWECHAQSQALRLDLPTPRSQSVCVCAVHLVSVRVVGQKLTQQ